MITIASPPIQATSKPTVPQISSVKLVDSSYDVPPSSTTTVDQYTGKETTTTNPGYRVNSKTIEVTIKNQPFTPYIDESYKDPAYGPNGREYNLYHKVQVKGHFGDNWKDFGGWVIQSNTGYTIVSGVFIDQVNVVNYDAGSQFDFRVQASIGYKYDEISGRLIFPYPGPVWVVVPTEYSDWSRTQTFTIPDSSSLSPPSQTTTLPSLTTTPDNGNNQPQMPKQLQPPKVIFTQPFFLLVISILFCGVTVAVVMVILKRQQKTQTYMSNSA